MGGEHRGLRAAMKDALRLLYPPQCLGCGTGIDAEGALCSDCWREATFITGACCGRCGAPLPDDGTAADLTRGDSEAGGDTMICDDCMAIARPWRQGRAALVYGGTGRALVLAFKHGDRPDLAPALATFVSRAAAPLIRPGMVVVPVPVHWRRLISRKYNQAEMLSGHVARLRGLDHLPQALMRHRPTPAQDHRGVADRFDNVADAFRVAPRMAGRIAGRAVLLVDDVMTSGATLGGCAEALIAAGSGPVSVAVLARAVRND